MSWNDAALGAARQDQREAEQDRADQHDDARAVAVAGRTPEETAEAHDDEIQRHRARYAGRRPAVVGNRLRKTASENIAPTATHVIVRRARR